MKKKSKFSSAFSVSENISPNVSPNKFRSIHLQPLQRKITFAQKQENQFSKIQQNSLKPSQNKQKSQKINKLPQLIIPYQKCYQRKKKTITNYDNMDHSPKEQKKSTKLNIFSNKFQPAQHKFLEYKQKGLRNMQNQYEAENNKKVLLSEKQNKKIIELKKKIKQMNEQELRIKRIDLKSILRNSHVNKEEDEQQKISRVLQEQSIENSDSYGQEKKHRLIKIKSTQLSKKQISIINQLGDNMDMNRRSLYRQARETLNSVNIDSKDRLNNKQVNSNRNTLSFYR